MGKNYAYVRISTENQKTDRQYDELLKYSKNNNIQYEVIFEDKLSGKDFNRPQYLLLKEKAVPGDTIYVKELDRFGRNYDEIKKQLDYFYNRNIKIMILDFPQLNIEDDGMAKVVNDILLAMLSYIAEKERLRINKNIQEGIKAAQKRGAKVGRPPLELSKQFYKYYKDWKAGKIKATEFAKLLEISYPSLWRWIKHYETEKKKAS